MWCKFVDADDASGPNTSGGFLIKTDPGTEFILSGTIGSQYHFNRHWAAEASIGADYHFADWDLKDTVLRYNRQYRKLYNNFLSHWTDL